MPRKGLNYEWVLLRIGIKKKSIDVIEISNAAI